MKRCCFHAAVVIVVLAATRSGASPEYIFFRAAFDQNPDAEVSGKALKPKTAGDGNYEAGDPGHAVIVGKGARLEYDLGQNFPILNGSLELRFKPNFPNDDKKKDRTVLAFSGPGRVRLALDSRAVGHRWVIVVRARKRWTREMTLWHGCVKSGRWNHVVVTWEKPGKGVGDFHVYLNGKWKSTAKYDGRVDAPTKLSLGGVDGRDAEISVDEVAVYRRALTEPQAKIAADTFQSKANRFVAISKKLAEDDAALAARRERVGQLKGKVGRLLHHRNMKPRPILLPEGVVAEAIRPQDIGKIDLSKYRVIYFPEGPNYQIDKDQYKHLIEYVQNGGGYVGSCQGAYFAAKVGLLDYKTYTCHVWGIFRVVLQPHVVNDYGKSWIPMHFGNGPIMVPGKGCNVLGKFVMSLPEAKTPAAILEGPCGKGRVVVFATHPLGGQVSCKGTRAFWPGKLLRTNRMLVNAMLYAAGLTNEADAKP